MHAMDELGAAELPLLPPGHELTPGYTVIDHLSRGHALDVYEVFSAERMCSCVAKLVRPDRRDTQRVVDRLLQEGRLLGELAHPHLVRAFETRTEPEPVVILETLPGPTLEDLLDETRRALPLADLAHLGRHICSAMHYLHAQGFLHLDLRPGNVMSQCGVAKVIDLSLARPPGPAPRGATPVPENSARCSISLAAPPVEGRYVGVRRSGHSSPTDGKDRAHGRIRRGCSVLGRRDAPRCGGGQALLR